MYLNNTNESELINSLLILLANDDKGWNLIGGVLNHSDLKIRISRSFLSVTLLNYEPLIPETVNIRFWTKGCNDLRHAINYRKILCQEAEAEVTYRKIQPKLKSYLS